MLGCGTLFRGIPRWSAARIGYQNAVVLSLNSLQTHGYHNTHRMHIFQQSLNGNIRFGVRTIKTKSYGLDVPPTGAAPLEPLAAPTTGRLPTVVSQARSHMLKYENCVLLTRVGGFYELYFEHAEVYGPLLNLKVAEKDTKSAGLVSMAGFPFMQLDRYLKILVQDLNCYVAIAEEFPNDIVAQAKSGGLLHDRKVARVITPGTLIDENFMDPFSNNYALAIYAKDGLSTTSGLESTQGSLVSAEAMPLGLAWLDVSTGHFSTQSISLAMLPSVLTRIGPRDIVLDSRFRDSSYDSGLLSILSEDRHLINFQSLAESKPLEAWNRSFGQQLSELPNSLSDFSAEEAEAGNILLHYVDSRLEGMSMKLQAPVKFQATETMVIDKNSMRALEIKLTIRSGQKKGTLLHAIRRTVTQGGARLLDERLNAPSTSVSTINGRLNLVTSMLNNREVAERIGVVLKGSGDTKRLVQKFTLGRGDADDMLALSKTISATVDLCELLNSAFDIKASEFESSEDSIKTMTTRIELEGPVALADRITATIDQEGLVQQHHAEDLETEAGLDQGLADDIDAIPEPKLEPIKKSKSKKATSVREYYAHDSEIWIMRSSASESLHSLHEELQNLKAQKVILETDLRSRLGAASLTLRWTPGLGHICHIRVNRKETLNLENVQSLTSSKSTRSLQHPEWTSLGLAIDQIRLRIRAEERRVFLELRGHVLLNLVHLRQNATVLDELDVACSFAALAEEQSLTRPILNDSREHKIVGGRHPTVQRGLDEQGRSFISNDCFVGNKEQLLVITGPNMAGKSTFLRQNALITIMAQIGSYVPAEYAEIGIVDQMFSRVGSADNLFRNESTFMVEMLETAIILNNATPRSFVIMDEIGRGTTPEDGVAVAFASLHHLYHVNKCRTLFATHFHSLADMSKDMEGVAYYCTDVAEDKEGGFSYVHKLRRGVNRESHALKVARIAGVPDAAILVAQEVLERGKN